MTFAYCLKAATETREEFDSLRFLGSYVQIHATIVLIRVRHIGSLVLTDY